MRHTFATRCIEAGIPPVVLKTWLGHTSIKITLDTYTDVFHEYSSEAMSLFESKMTGIKIARILRRSAKKRFVGAPSD